VLTPIVLSLYVSTFYGRYHYVTDAVVGVAVAFLALAVAPLLIKLWDRITERSSEKLALASLPSKE
jgi:membrane-associated phospholipid phosphatase